ncbi:hypothetical protein G6F22_017771 [Rhizopus arrhizus]|nr:hypothetical protein G6F22_017771 [Rhizopus arrhizus]
MREPSSEPPLVPRILMMRVILSMISGLVSPAAADTTACRSCPLAVLRPPPPPMLCATMPAEPLPCVAIVPVFTTRLGLEAVPPPEPPTPPLPPVW